jgi:hypothetical protein
MVLLLLAIGTVPALAGYVHARYYYFKYEKRSFRQLTSVVLALVFVLGAFILQSEIVARFGSPEDRQFLRILTPFQYTLALIVMFRRLKLSAALANGRSTDNDRGQT